MCLLIVLLSSVVTGVVGKDTCPSSATASCPLSWHSWRHSCYRPTDESADWDQSKLACQAMGGKMAVPYSLEENEFMIRIAQRENIKDFWIGCNDREREGTWACEGQGDSEPFFNWIPGQPNNWRKNQHCAIIKSEGGMVWDGECDKRLQTLCSRSPRSGHYCFATGTRGELPNSCLLDHVIREIVTKSKYPYLGCAFLCMKEPMCRSFNIKQNKLGLKMCQLNDATSCGNMDNFQEVDSLCIHAQECIA